MPNDTKHNYGRKVTAVGFILMILIGNFWIIEEIMGKKPPIWMQNIGFLGLFLVVLGGFMLLFQFIKEWLNAREH